MRARAALAFAAAFHPSVRVMCPSLRFIEMRNTGASSKVTVDDLVRATLPDVILTIEAMRVEQKRR